MVWKMVWKMVCRVEKKHEQLKATVVSRISNFGGSQFSNFPTSKGRTIGFCFVHLLQVLLRRFASDKIVVWSWVGGLGTELTNCAWVTYQILPNPFQILLNPMNPWFWVVSSVTVWNRKAFGPGHSPQWCRCGPYLGVTQSQLSGFSKALVVDVMNIIWTLYMGLYGNAMGL